MTEIARQIQSIKKTISELEAQRSRLESEIFYNYQMLGAKYAAERLLVSATNDFHAAPRELPAPLPKGTIAKNVSALFRKNPTTYFNKEEIVDALMEEVGQKVSLNAVHVALKRAEKRGEIAYEGMVDSWHFIGKQFDEIENDEDLPF